MKKFVIITLLSLFAANLVKAQTLGFAANRDTIADLESLTFYNQSSGFSSNQSFLWTVNAGIFFTNSQLFFSKVTMGGESV